MYSNYKTGDISTQEFADLKQPKALPTYEWDKEEIRSYSNYIRPIGNLFENTRENNYLAKSIFSGITKDTATSGIVYGCSVINPEGEGVCEYKEVSPGVFINSGVLYEVFPTCNLCAKQIEKKLYNTGHTNISVKIEYKDSKFSGTLDVDNLATVTVSNKDTAIEFLYALNSGSTVKFIDSTDTIATYRLLPVSTSANLYYSNSKGYITNDSVSSGDVITDFINPSTFYMSGNSLKNSSIPNSKIANPYVTYGSTQVSLGGLSTTITGLDSVNGLTLTDKGTDNGFEIGGGSKTLKVTKDYTLGDACAKAIATSINSTTTSDNIVPTVHAVVDYFSSGAQTFSGDVVFNNKMTSTSTVELGGGTGETRVPVVINPSGVINVKNETSASMTIDGQPYTGTTVSGTITATSGAEIIEGGLAVKQNIISAGDILGQNVSSRSARALKENILPFEKNATEIVNSVDIVSYNMKADPNKEFKVGFIADDTDAILSTVNHDKMDMNNCIGILLKAVQELSAEVKTLKEEINDLKSSEGK